VPATKTETVLGVLEEDMAVQVNRIRGKRPVKVRICGPTVCNEVGGLGRHLVKDVKVGDVFLCEERAGELTVPGTTKKRMAHIEMTSSQKFIVVKERRALEE